MAEKVNTETLAEAIFALKKTGQFSRITNTVTESLSLKSKLSVFKLKTLLIKATKDHWGEAKEADMVLMELGLLDGYYQDIRYVEGALARETKDHAARRLKYLKYGPYIRTKRGKRYEFFDDISEDELKDVKNSLGKQVGRLISDLLEDIKIIAERDEVVEYIKKAIKDPDFDYACRSLAENGKVRYVIRLPKQNYFLEDFPSPKEKVPATKSKSPATKAATSVSHEISQSTAELIHTPHGWGDSSPTGTRPIYTREQIDGGVLGDRVVFNSISNSVSKIDERFFVGARVDDGIHRGAENLWHCNQILAEDQKEYIIRCYIHNNNPRGPYATAKNVKVGFRVPSLAATCIPVTGFISSSNANPDKYWATVVFKSDTPFRLFYKPGTALLENNGIANRVSSIFAKLNDDIIISESSDGVLIHYDTLDGSIPGCYKYASYVAIRVSVVFEKPHDIIASQTVSLNSNNHNQAHEPTKMNLPAFQVKPQIRLAGTDDWSQTIEAEVGDLVEISIQYQNLSDFTNEDVMIRDILPTNLVYIPGSTKLYNTNNPAGFPVPQDKDKVATTGINIGTYEAGANAYVQFTAKVVDATLASGFNTLASWSQCCVNRTTLQDRVTVKIWKEE